MPDQADTEMHTDFQDRLVLTAASCFFSQYLLTNHENRQLQNALFPPWRNISQEFLLLAVILSLFLSQVLDPMILMMQI